MTVDTQDSSFIFAARHIRNIWRTQEEDQLLESLEYTKRNLTLLDYLASVSHAGNEISIRSLNYESRGALVHIGKDFFSIVSPKMPRVIHSFVFNGDIDTAKVRDIEIDVLEKTEQAQNVRLLRHDKSFKSLLNDIASHPDNVEIETEQGHLYTGPFTLFSDCISVNENEDGFREESLVSSGTTIIPINRIVSVLYTV